MNRRTTVLLIVLIIGVVGLALVIGLVQGKAASQSCKSKLRQSYQIVINKGSGKPREIRGHLCDSLTFLNKDDVTREIAFGSHEDHVPYNGVAEKFLNKNQSFTITFDQVGRFHWHDHIHDEVEGYFTVDK